MLRCAVCSAETKHMGETRPGIAGVRPRGEETVFVLCQATKQITRETTVQTAITNKIGWPLMTASVGEMYVSDCAVASVDSGAAAVLLLRWCKVIPSSSQGNLGQCSNLAFVRQKNE